MNDENLKYQSLITNLQQDVSYERALKEQYLKDLKILNAWILKNTNCKTCKGDRMKTMGGFPCKECGLEGTQPWGG